MTPFTFNEQHLSQIPALQMLMGLSYKVLSPEDLRRERGGELANVLLEGILQKRLLRP